MYTRKRSKEKGAMNRKTEKTPALLKAADVAQELGVTTGRVYQLISAGLLPHINIGGGIRIPRSAWEKWLSEQTVKALEASIGGNDGTPR